MPKFCRVCNVELIEGSNWSDGQRRASSYRCLPCLSDNGKRHYKLHAERAARLQRERLHIPEKAKLASEYKSAYYAKNKDKWREYHAVQKEKENSDPWARSGRMLIWIRKRAAKMQCEFDLTREWIELRLTHGTCEVTGLKFDLGRDASQRFNPWCPSIDRTDPSKGYTQDNCRAVVWIYNMAKSGWTDDVVMQFAKALTSRERNKRT